jgi:hypothetical protein
MMTMIARYLAFSRASLVRLTLARGLWGLLCGLSCVAVSAQEDRQEALVPPPASFATDQLIPVTVAGPSELKVGIDPKQLSIGPDKIVRYVLVAQGSNGLLTVTFEGIDCKTAATRVLARWNVGTQQWRVLDTSEWKSLNDDRGSRYAKALARGGVCDGPTPTTPLSSMMLALRTGRTSYNH